MRHLEGELLGSPLSFLQRRRLRLTDLDYSLLLKGAQSRLGGYLTPALRLGVTGLSRAGKTVFITALVRNLVTGGRLPFFEPDAEGRIVRAYLEPQPDDSVPRFDYETHLEDLFASPPRWPESTRRISELRLTVEYRSASWLKRTAGLSKIHIDIVDYPGEWLVDLAMLEQSFAEFSAEALARAEDPWRSPLSAEFRNFIAGLDANAAADEQVALTGSRLFTSYLRATRQSGATATLAPGRFLLPGDLEGSPLLTFFPLAAAADRRAGSGSLHALLERRFESYKQHVVRRFFNDHFSRLDRQIVLVDVLGALNGGADAVVDLERSMSGILRAFKPAANSWLSVLLGRRLDRVLFAATKADHLQTSSHDRLQAVLRRIVDKSLAQAEDGGARVAAIAIAALRATREGRVREGGEDVPCLRGTPIKGERIGGKTFDGVTETALFPGDLPADPDAALDRARASGPGMLEVVRFAPPRLADKSSEGSPAAFPHIRLDRALEFLIADYLT